MRTGPRDPSPELSVDLLDYSGATFEGLEKAIPSFESALANSPRCWRWIIGRAFCCHPNLKT
jgi:hypothetical protein